jgi:hypothetical protein
LALELPFSKMERPFSKFPIICSTFHAYTKGVIPNSI